MVHKASEKYFDKVSKLCGNGWKKLHKGWLDPLTGDSQLSLKEAFKRHLKYEEKYGNSD